MSELKPCPFCGGEAHTRTNTAFTTLFKWTVECGTDDCNGLFGCRFYPTEAEAIEAWNTRAERTCQFEINTDMSAVKCSECGYKVPKGTNLNEARFCIRCGARVVDE